MSGSPTSIQEALRQGTDLLSGVLPGMLSAKPSDTLLQPAKIDTPKLEAEVLLCHCLDQPRSYLFTWPERAMSEHQYNAYLKHIEQRAQGVPVAYLTGVQEFWSLDFEVNEHTLIPRPETELLIETALGLYPSQGPRSVVDLGTGSGCIAVALAHERPQWQVTAVDKSMGALSTAQANAKRHGVAVRFLQSHWCDALNGGFDLVVSNPPYIKDQDPHLSQGDLRFEPESALSSGEDGLKDIRLIAQQALAQLRPKGHLILEFGYHQSEEVTALLKDLGYQDITLYHDLNGIGRAISACRPID